MASRLTELCAAIAEAGSERDDPLGARAAAQRLSGRARCRPSSRATRRRRSPAWSPADLTAGRIPHGPRRPRRARPRSARGGPRLRPRARPRARPRPRAQVRARRSGGISAGMEEAAATGPRREALGAHARVDRAGDDDALHALARRGARGRARRLRRALALVGGPARGLLGLDLGLLRGPRLEAVRRRPRRPLDAGRRVVHRRRAELRRAPLPRPRRRRGRDPLRLGDRRELAELTWGEFRAQVAAAAAGLRELGVGRGDRVVAYMPNVPETIVAFAATASLGAIWSSCSPDFGASSVVDRFAQIEPKVLFAVDGYRYGGARLRPPRRRRRPAGGDADPRAHRGPPLHGPGSRPLPARERDRLGRAARIGRGRRAHLRAGPVRPPALGPLLLGDHRPAEGDRPGPRRDPARAPEEAPPPPRRAGGRPRLLVHDDRLDDVELPRRRAADPRRDRHLRRQPGRARHGRPLGPRREDRHDLLRHQRQLRRRLHEGRGRAVRRARPLARCARSGSTGSPLSPEGFDWIYEHVGADTWLFSTSGGTDVCTAFVGGVPLLPVYRGELQGRSLGRRGRGLERGRRARRSTRSASS